MISQTYDRFQSLGIHVAAVKSVAEPDPESGIHIPDPQHWCPQGLLYSGNPSLVEATALTEVHSLWA
jgi:hypothetical protein